MFSYGQGETPMPSTGMGEERGKGGKFDAYLIYISHDFNINKGKFIVINSICELLLLLSVDRKQQLPTKQYTSYIYKSIEKLCRLTILSAYGHSNTHTKHGHRSIILRSIQSVNCCCCGLMQSHYWLCCLELRDIGNGPVGSAGIVGAAADNAEEAVLT